MKKSSICKGLRGFWVVFIDHVLQERGQALLSAARFFARHFALLDSANAQRFRQQSLSYKTCYQLRNQQYLGNWVIKAGIPPCGSSSRAKPLSRCSTRQWLSRHKKTALAGTRRGYFIPRSIDFGRKRQLLQRDHKKHDDI